MALPSTARRRIRIRLRGIVQGVGFRPFVHNLARELRLGGYVSNSSAGLVAEAEGEPAALDRFVRTVTGEPPPLAWIQETEIVEMEALGEDVFTIRSSVAVAGEFALVSPDVATCEECFGDFTRPADRRYGYPFTNCTNCGPRYTIVQDIPYDRPKTTMSVFRMCEACRAEYEDPADRRFHAQPNACPVCGPRIWGCSMKGCEEEGWQAKAPAPPGADPSAPLVEARRRLAAGEILAIKGLGGFQLACDARNPAAVARLRARKRRSDKPFAVMARDLAAVEEVCALTDADKAALSSPRRPIVILPRTAALPEALAPGNRTLGVMLPYTPLHHLLFAGAPYSLLVMTSGNLSEEPIVVSNDEALARLAGVADWFLLHNRDIYMRVDDSVARVFAGRERVLRRSRGYAPHTLDLGRAVPELLACGGELKNAFCLTKGRHAILSQHIGDLENYETLVFFEETLANLKKLFRITPRAVAHDLHPAYLSTKYALAIPDLPKIAVQHHHAHVASCMAENGLTGVVIGVAFDGTGYGPDGAIWGGEFLVAGYAGFERRGRLRYVLLAGGDAAIREPWRAALAYLEDALGSPARIAGVPEERARVVRRMMERGVNTVPTSSCGRLFDAVAAIIGLRREVTFEGQAAMELETIAEPGEEGLYPFEMEGGDLWQVDFRPAIERIARETGAGVPPGAVAARFHNTLAAAMVETCRRIRGAAGPTRVCLSGGTFQNVRLTESAAAGLREAGFEVFLHSRVPPNDGGIALGQAAIAAELLQAGGPC
ncbi:MAG: carbamoyltransferase HypF [Bryobacteraceae bacterium]|jgi:hydrogenase maturation protein HypF